MRIDRALQAWRQGDLALEEEWFVHVGDPAEPLTEVAAEAGVGGTQALTSAALGLAVVTQTCDVIRTCVERPYLEVSPLIRLSDDEIIAAQRGNFPALAT